MSLYNDARLEELIDWKKLNKRDFSDFDNSFTVVENRQVDGIAL